MKILQLALIAAFSLATARAQNADSQEAVALVRAMRSDEMILQASTTAMALAAKEGHYTDAQLKCFMTLQSSAFTADLAKIVAHALTPQEITEALAFYSSAAGVKFVEFNFATLKREMEGSTPSKSSESGPAMPYQEM